MKDNETMYIPTLADMLVAHERIKPYIHRTPVLTSRFINELAGAELFFKCENLQKAGAFKARGASNAVFGLSEEQAAKSLRAGNPQGRFIQTDEVAGAALWLCSEAARSVNGHALGLTGGEI